MNMTYKGFLAVFLLTSVLGLTACDRDKPAETTGSAVEQPADRKTDQAGVFMDDAAITANVKAELANDPMLKDSPIIVTTTNGTVRLSGTVDSQQIIDRALEITRKVKNVQATENGMVVKGTN
jgi:hyperosmotically inducible periplasmic protein